MSAILMTSCTQTLYQIVLSNGILLNALCECTRSDTRQLLFRTHVLLIHIVYMLCAHTL